MGEVSSRLRARIARDFRLPGEADDVIRLVESASDSARVQAAIVFAARGNKQWIHDGVALAVIDWRDVLVNGGLDSEGWSETLDRELGA